MKPELIQSPNPAPPTVDLSRTEHDRYMRRARHLRAAAFNCMFKSVARAVATLFRGFKQAHDRRRAIAELRRLDQRTLKDIGIERSQIPLIIEQLYERRKADGDPRKYYPLRALAVPPASRAASDNDERCPPLAA